MYPQLKTNFKILGPKYPFYQLFLAANFLLQKGPKACRQKQVTSIITMSKTMAPQTSHPPNYASIKLEKDHREWQGAMFPARFSYCLCGGTAEAKAAISRLYEDGQISIMAICRNGGISRDDKIIQVDSLFDYSLLVHEFVQNSLHIYFLFKIIFTKYTNRKRKAYGFLTPLRLYIQSSILSLTTVGI